VSQKLFETALHSSRLIGGPTGEPVTILLPGRYSGANFNTACRPTFNSAGIGAEAPRPLRTRKTDIVSVLSSDRWNVELKFGSDFHCSALHGMEQVIFVRPRLPHSEFMLHISGGLTAKAL
jgi:hypothetical protein